VVLFGLFAAKSRTCQLAFGEGELRWGTGVEKVTFVGLPSYDVGEDLFGREWGEVGRDGGWRKVDVEGDVVDDPLRRQVQNQMGQFTISILIC